MVVQWALIIQLLYRTQASLDESLPKVLSVNQQVEQQTQVQNTYWELFLNFYNEHNCVQKKLVL